MANSKHWPQHRYSPEMRERAVRIEAEAIAENGGDRFGVIPRIAKRLGVTESLRAGQPGRDRRRLANDDRCSLPHRWRPVLRAVDAAIAVRFASGFVERPAPRGVRALAERIRVAVADEPFELGDHHIPVTMSAGCAAGPAGAPDELVRRADVAR